MSLTVLSANEDNFGVKEQQNNNVISNLFLIYTQNKNKSFQKINIL